MTSEEKKVTPVFLGKIISFFSEVNLSIRAKILTAFFIVMFLMGSVVALYLVGSLRYKSQYDSIITNITAANSINGYVKQAIDAEMWNIVAGKTTFGAGKQYQLIEATENKIRQMMANTTSNRGHLKLDVILRTLSTLRGDINQMGTQIARGSTTAENEATLERIRDVTQLIDINIQDYILFEIRRAEQQYAETQQNFIRWVWTSAVIMFLAVIFSILAAWVISESVYVPIKKLHDVTTTITQRDLAVLATGHHANEISELGTSFNLMIGQIRELLDFKTQEQENLKKAELRALQAQIHPHFLYNSLEAIISMAESNRNTDVVRIVRALSSFFRISLSKGKDWISIRDEVEHVVSYLTIQQMRYHNILDYIIDIDPLVLDGTILKFTLQPLVENALYHGIKNKRDGGTITMRSHLLDPQTIYFEVADDGRGMEPDKLAEVQATLQTENVTVVDNAGFGINNVNTRLKLYYGRQYGLKIQSEYQVGTSISLTIPYISAKTASVQKS
jgi:two-component system, sensor histidine kinase YesM